MLPVKSLAYPGAVEDSRHFAEAIEGRTVDGTVLQRPAELIIRYRVDGTIEIDPIRTWYRDRLTAEGWTTEDFDPTEQDVVMRTTRDGLEHTFIVEAYGAEDLFALRYQIRPTG